MPTISVSPPCQGSPMLASFQSRVGTRPGFSPGSSMSSLSPKPKRCAMAAMRSMPTRLANS